MTNAILEALIGAGLLALIWLSFDYGRIWNQISKRFEDHEKEQDR